MTVHVAARVTRIAVPSTVVPVRSSWMLEHYEPSVRETIRRTSARAGRQLSEKRIAIRQRIADKAGR